MAVSSITSRVGYLRVFLSNNSFEKRYVIRSGIHGDSAAADHTGTGNDVGEWWRDELPDIRPIGDAIFRNRKSRQSFGHTANVLWPPRSDHATDRILRHSAVTRCKRSNNCDVIQRDIWYRSSSHWLYTTTEPQNMLYLKCHNRSRRGSPRYSSKSVTIHRYVNIFEHVKFHVSVFFIQFPIFNVFMLCLYLRNEHAIYLDIFC